MTDDIEMFQYTGLRIDDGKPHHIEVIISSSAISLAIDAIVKEMAITEPANRPVGNLFIGNTQENTE